MRPSALTSIYCNARSQAQLVDDLLDISRIITGRLSIESKPVETAGLSALVAELAGRAVVS